MQNSIKIGSLYQITLKSGVKLALLGEEIESETLKEMVAVEEIASDSGFVVVNDSQNLKVHGVFTTEYFREYLNNKYPLKDINEFEFFESARLFQQTYETIMSAIQQNQ